MHKYISAIVLSTLSVTAAAHGKWEVGAAVGAGASKFKQDLNRVVLGTTSRYQFDLQGSGPVGGLIAGYTIKRNLWLYGLTVGASKDFYVPRSHGRKTDRTANNVTITTKNDVRKKYTFEFAGKLGHMINSDTHAYGKLGAVYSNFREQFGEIDDPVVDIRRNIKAWGGVAGVGIKKEYSMATVGFEYNYQYYSKIGSTMMYGAGDIYKAKFRPQYHNVLLTLSKSF